MHSSDWDQGTPYCRVYLVQAAVPGKNIEGLYVLLIGTPYAVINVSRFKAVENQLAVKNTIQKNCASGQKRQHLHAPQRARWKHSDEAAICTALSLQPQRGRHTSAAASLHPKAAASDPVATLIFDDLYLQKNGLAAGSLPYF